MELRQLSKPARPNVKAMSLAVAACFSVSVEIALANPTGAAVISGSALFNRQGNLLAVTNSPGAIINWQGFSIAQNEVTRFIQQSSASSVLNRVVGVDPSIILGALQSNGRVFLINPNGILFGAGAQIDVAGLVASTLNLTNADFLAGRLRFTDVAGAGSINNQGAITTPTGGQVYLVAPNVQNSGIITSPQGEVILAAGRSVELVDAGTPNLRVEITAPDTAAVNVGEIVANSGKVGIYAGLIRNSGVIKADGVVVGQNGEILLKAAQSTTLDAGSTVSASGTQGGSVTIQSGDTTLVSGSLEATGSASMGGTVKILGKLVGVLDGARVNASGDTGGGTVLVGGDYHGGNPGVQNALRTYVGPDAVIHADAITSGDGGKVIVWSDEATRAYGLISARGGAVAGNGGFVETSGSYLDVTRAPDISAPMGTSGTWLLDPVGIVVDTIAITTADSNITSSSPFQAAAPGTSTLNAATLVTALNAGGTVIVDTSAAAGAGNGDITVNAALNTAPSAPATLDMRAHNNIKVNANIVSTGNPLQIKLTADQDNNGMGGVNVNATLTANNNNIIITSGQDVVLGSSGILNTGNIFFAGSGSAAINVTVKNPNGSIITSAGSKILANSAITLQSDNLHNSGSIGFVSGVSPGTIVLRPNDITRPVIFETGVPTAGAYSIDPTGNSLITAGTLQIGDSNLTSDISFNASPQSSGVTADLIKLVGQNININAPIGTAASRFAHGVMLQAKGDVNIRDNVYIGNFPVTLAADADTNGIGSVNIIAQSSPLTVDTLGGLTVSGVNLQVGSAGTTKSTTVNAGGNIGVNLTGNLAVSGGTATAGGSTVDASAKVHGGQNINITAAGITVAGGIAHASGTISAAEHAAANAELSAGGAATLTIGTGGLHVNGGSAVVRARAADNYDAAANALLAAGGAMGITVSGAGTVSIAGGSNARAQASGGAAALVSANASALAGGNLDINTAGGALGVTGGNNAWALALGAGANTASVNANAALTSTAGHVNVALSGGGLTIAGGNAARACGGGGSASPCAVRTPYPIGPFTVNAGASALVSAGTTVDAQAGSLTVNGGNNGKALARDINRSNPGASFALGTAATAQNAGLSAGQGMTLTVTGPVVVNGGTSAFASACCAGEHNGVGEGHATAAANALVKAANGNLALTAGSLTVSGGNRADASACCNGSHSANGGAATAVTNANAEVSAGQSMTLMVAGPITISGGSNAYASACCNGFGKGTGSGTPTTNANALVRAGTSMTVTAGSLTVSGGKGVDASACCNGSSGGNGVGVTATNANAELSAGQSMSLTISGTVAISGASNAYASACCNGEGGTVPGGNGRGTPVANGNALVHAGTTLTLSAGSLAVSGGKRVDGSACCVGERGGTTGNGTVTVNANAELSAGQSMALTVSGPVNIAGGASAYASACCVGEGGVGRPGGNGQATVTASANALVHAGTDLTLTAGSLTVHGGNKARASASEAAWKGGTGTATVTVNATGELSAGQSMGLAVSGPVTVAGGNSGGANGCCNALGSASTRGGTGQGTALVNANASISAGSSLTMNAGGLTVSGGNGAHASACCNASNGNAGTGIATVRAGAGVSAGDTMALMISGPVSVAGGNSAKASASNNGVGGGNGTGSATVDANAIVLAGKALTLTATSMSVRGGSNAIAFASSNVGPGGGAAKVNANGLMASGGDMSLAVTAGNLTVAAGTARASTSGSGASTAKANANAGILSLGAKSVMVSGNVNLNGGVATASGAGAAANAFALLDPGSLALTANGITLTPGSPPTAGGAAYAGVVLSAAGPIDFNIGGSPVDVATLKAQYAGTPGVTIGQTTVISADPLIISVADPVVLNLTDLFGLPAGTLHAVVTVVTQNIPLPADIFRNPLALLDPPKNDPTLPPADDKKDKTGNTEKKEDKQISKGLKAECD